MAADIASTGSARPVQTPSRPAPWGRTSTSTSCCSTAPRPALMASLVVCHRRHRQTRLRPLCCRHHRRRRLRRPIRTRDASTTLGTAMQAGVVQTGLVGRVAGRSLSASMQSCCCSAVPTLAPMVLPCASRRHPQRRRHPSRHPRPRRRLTCSGASATPSNTRSSSRSPQRCSIVKKRPGSQQPTAPEARLLACSVSPSGPERGSLASCQRMGATVLWRRANCIF